MSTLRQLCRLVVIVFAGLSAVAEVKLPDRAEGNVNGLQGINFWPIDDQQQLVDPVGCFVYLVPSDVNQRLSYPCGKWIAPPAGRYTMWLEQGTRISHQTVVVNGGRKFEGNGMVSLMPL